MKYALIGYGRMGQTIEKEASVKGHELVGYANTSEWDEKFKNDILNADVAIEFTQPENAYENIKWCLEHHIKVVSGTTGWLSAWNEIVARCNQQKGGFFYASNFSVGVNILFELNKRLASIMQSHPDYIVSMEEIHHIHKKDVPSGTAITLAEGIIGENKNYTGWSLEEKTDHVTIHAKRENEVPGTHSVSYISEIDEILIQHKAKSRKGFALGAVMAAEWLIDKQGVFGMNDLLNL